ncbi:hypothetical protein MSAN_00223700 [Mycena sanguinolenta]|uniref:Uncharacterized protein n=1 Tax=Mycena sanguinolenta TaxID=230812 RepID=A0A8H7DMN8_9AGAR|nr:hypothetical protein MSAN_00223700 [Mycena sanguinolenta]
MAQENQTKTISSSSAVSTMCQADYAKNVYISAIGGTGGSGGAGDTKGKIVIWGDKLKEVLHEWLTPPKVILWYWEKCTKLNGD